MIFHSFSKDYNYFIQMKILHIKIMLYLITGNNDISKVIVCTVLVTVTSAVQMTY